MCCYSFSRRLRFIFKDHSSENRFVRFT
uniref:Uncharacterized protein n=1 Tax=Anguilla anguilla TaxID=7936 RepID=A0A0E9TNK9_ANGAN